jgi:hypothetical protein
VSLLPARQKGVENNPFLRGTGFVDTGDKRNVLRILEVKCGFSRNVHHSIQQKALATSRLIASERLVVGVRERPALQ